MLEIQSVIVTIQIHAKNENYHKRLRTLKLDIHFIRIDIDNFTNDNLKVHNKSRHD